MENQERALSKALPGQLSASEQFQGMTAHQRAEIAAIQVATTAKAEVEAGYIMALKAPRNEDQARQDILAACKRLKFAEKSRYKKPIAGTFIEGPSIRFAEEMARAWGNLKIQHVVIYEDDNMRVSKITVFDLQKNISDSAQITIEKTVERKKITPDRDVIAERINSKGERVFIVQATDDEINIKEAALASKKRRNLILHMIPADIIDEAMEEAIATVKAGIDKDPNAAKKKILDSFFEIGIKPVDIEKYIGHSLDTVSPAELADLRTVYTSIKDGTATWKEYLTKEVEAPAEDKGPEVANLKAGDPATHQDVKNKGKDGQK